MSRYTFNPPEEELIGYYLNNKIIGKDDGEGRQINEVNIRHHEPVDLPGVAKIESSHTWYFISPVEKFGKLHRRKRASRTGHWKITGNNCTIKDADGNHIGLKKFLVFQENKNKRSSTSSSSTTSQQHKFTWIIHEFHSFLHHPNKDAFVLCKLMKKTRTRRSGGVADASPAATDLSPTLTSDPILLNHSQLTQNKNTVVEDDGGGDYCNDLEELIPEFDSSSWLDHYHQCGHLHRESFSDTLHSWEQGESSGLPLGENSHVYGQHYMENSNHLELGEYWNSEAVVGPVNGSNADNDQI